MNKTRIFVDRSIKIEIASSVLQVWEYYKQDGLFSREACGILIGTFLEKQNLLKITNCTKPLPLDERSKYSFVLKDSGHQKAVDQARFHSDGQRNYIGTWHTHPERHPKPSYEDKQDWKKVVDRNPNLSQFVFVIVGTESVSVFPKKGINYKNVI